MDGQTITVMNLDEYVEGGRRLAFEYGLLSSATARLLVGEGDGLDAAQQIVQGGVDQQVLEGIAMRGGHQLHPALGDGSGRRRLQLGADLVDDDHLGHVVLDGLDHHGMLQRRSANLHPPRAADPGMRDVTITADLVRGVDDDHPLLHLIGQHAGALAQHRRLADARAPQQQDALPADDHVLDDVDRAGDGPADPAGDAHDLAAAIADHRDAVERALDASPVVVTERSDPARDELEVFRGDRRLVEDHLVVGKAGLGLAAQVEHHFQQQTLVIEAFDRPVDVRRQRLEELVELSRIGVGQAIVRSPQFVHCFSHIAAPTACP